MGFLHFQQPKKSGRLSRFSRITTSKFRRPNVCGVKIKFATRLTKMDFTSAPPPQQKSRYPKFEQSSIPVTA